VLSRTAREYKQCYRARRAIYKLSGQPRRRILATTLSPGTLRRIAALFPGRQRAEAAQLLAEECGDNLPLADTLGAAGIERIRFAVLKISQGSLDRLWEAVELAQHDWRDALVGAGFGDDITAHLRWLVDT
jgi:hypothetical protein